MRIIVKTSYSAIFFMKRFFNSSTAFLWVLIMGTLVLLGGQAAGFDWEFSENKGLGRLLAHPAVAAIEVFLAAMLILLPAFDYPYKKWVDPVPGFRTA